MKKEFLGWIRRDSGKQAGNVVFVIGAVVIYFAGQWAAGRWAEGDKLIASLPALVGVLIMIGLRWQYARTGNGNWMIGAIGILLYVAAYIISALGHSWLA